MTFPYFTCPEGAACVPVTVVTWCSTLAWSGYLLLNMLKVACLIKWIFLTHNESYDPTVYQNVLFWVGMKRD